MESTKIIIIKGEIRTQDVSKCEYDEIIKKWKIEFNPNDKENSNYKRNWEYNKDNVNIVEKIEEIKTKYYKIIYKNKELANVISIFKCQDIAKKQYYHITFRDKTEEVYNDFDVELEEIKECDKKHVYLSNKCFEYLEELASINSLKTDTGNESILKIYYDQIRIINGTALSKYLDPTISSYNNIPYNPIFPFGCNMSQYKAVKGAMTNQISVIQGPPGTGKTQTILNIIANILMRNKNVLVVSNNNAAIDNVYEKLSTYNLDFVVAKLGKKENKDAFLQNQTLVYPDLTCKCELQERELKKQIKDTTNKLLNVFTGQENLAKLKQELSMLNIEYTHFIDHLNTTGIKIISIKTKKEMSSSLWISLWNECQKLSNAKNKLGLRLKFKLRFKYKIINKEVYKLNISNLITILQDTFYKAKKEEINSLICKIEAELKESENLSNDLSMDSLTALKMKLKTKYSDKKRRNFESSDLKSEEFITQYPVILSTTFSSKTSLNPNFIFDYLIMDEASQVDISTGALALSCAKSAIIVGDTKQLPNIVSKEVKEQALQIFNNYKLDDGYKITNSFLESIIHIFPKITNTLLREHYRCHPKIINFCNQKFYDNQLIIMTTDNGEEDVLTAVKTVKGNHARNNYSQRQITEIRRIISENGLNAKDTAIITPYNNQVDALRKEFKEFEVDTVHKFQGREMKDVIISTVDDEISEFVDEPHLLNVAISRAKNRLFLVVSGNAQKADTNIMDLVNYIEYNNFDVIESNICSIFDYLYSQYEEERKEFHRNYKGPSKYDSENLMASTLDNILKDNKFSHLKYVFEYPLKNLINKKESIKDKELREFAMKDYSHIDFIIYNKLSRKCVLAIEVDGYTNHNEVKQKIRDEKKNKLLELCGLPLMRFSTNGDQEKQKIIKKLSELENKMY